MTNLLLADAMDASKTLFKAVWVPRQVVIDHQVGILKIHAFTRRISGEEYADCWVRTEKGLTFAAFIAMCAAMNGNDGIGSAEDTADFPFKIVQKLTLVRLLRPGILIRIQ